MSIRAGLRVTTGRDRSALHRAHTRFEVKGRAEGLRREVLARQVREDDCGIEKEGLSELCMPEWKGGIDQALTEIVHLSDAAPDVVLLN